LRQLRLLLNSGKKMTDEEAVEAFDQILHARVILLSNGDVPKIWETRCPDSGEVRRLIEIAGEMGFDPARTARQILYAMRKTGKLEEFAGDFPNTFDAVTQLSKETVRMRCTTELIDTITEGDGTIPVGVARELVRRFRKGGAHRKAICPVDVCDANDCPQGSTWYQVARAAAYDERPAVW
jgi:hypothetical protein